MAPKSNFLIIILTILISFSPIFLSTYSFPDHEFDNDNHGNHKGIDSQDLVHNNRVILERHRHHSHHQGSRIINVEHSVKCRGGDDTKALMKAWKEACSTKGGVFLVPKKKTYMVRPVNFTGPCHPHLTVKILGTIRASTNMSDYSDRYHWLVFQKLQNFKVEGGGTIDGRGHIWWQNSCKINKTKPCLHAPTAVMFLGCKNFTVDGLKIRNPQQMHISIQYSSNIRISNVSIKAPGNSPNTDGININATTNLQIKRCSIATGDDCVSIVNGSEDIEVSHIICGPGHGISIGSLGKNHSMIDHVSNVFINKARFSGTKNGVRIKSWQGGRGYANNITFTNIAMHNVSNPMIIDQYYCDQQTACSEQKSAVQVSNVTYKNIQGTSFTEPAIKFNCSKSHHCREILLQNVNLVMEKGEGAAKAECQNAEVLYKGKVSPRCSQET